MLRHRCSLIDRQIDGSLQPCGYTQHRLDTGAKGAVGQPRQCTQRSRARHQDIHPASANARDWYEVKG